MKRVVFILFTMVACHGNQDVPTGSRQSPITGEALAPTRTTSLYTSSSPGSSISAIGSCEYGGNSTGCDLRIAYKTGAKRYVAVRLKRKDGSSELLKKCMRAAEHGGAFTSSGNRFNSEPARLQLIGYDWARHCHRNIQPTVLAERLVAGSQVPVCGISQGISQGTDGAPDDVFRPLQVNAKPLAFGVELNGTFEAGSDIFDTDGDGVEENTVFSLLKDAGIKTGAVGISWRTIQGDSDPANMILPNPETNWNWLPTDTAMIQNRKHGLDNLIVRVMNVPCSAGWRQYKNADGGCRIDHEDPALKFDPHNASVSFATPDPLGGVTGIEQWKSFFKAAVYRYSVIKGHTDPKRAVKRWVPFAEIQNKYRGRHHIRCVLKAERGWSRFTIRDEAEARHYRKLLEASFEIVMQFNNDYGLVGEDRVLLGATNIITSIYVEDLGNKQHYWSYSQYKGHKAAAVSVFPEDTVNDAICKYSYDSLGMRSDPIPVVYDPNWKFEKASKWYLDEILKSTKMHFIAIHTFPRSVADAVTNFRHVKTYITDNFAHHLNTPIVIDSTSVETSDPGTTHCPFKTVTQQEQGKIISDLFVCLKNEGAAEISLYKVQQRFRSISRGGQKPCIYKEEEETSGNARLEPFIERNGLISPLHCVDNFRTDCCLENADNADFWLPPVAGTAPVPNPSYCPDGLQPEACLIVQEKEGAAPGELTQLFRPYALCEQKFSRLPAPKAAEMLAKYSDPTEALSPTPSYTGLAAVIAHAETPKVFQSGYASGLGATRILWVQLSNELRQSLRDSYRLEIYIDNAAEPVATISPTSITYGPSNHPLYKTAVYVSIPADIDSALVQANRAQIRFVNTGQVQSPLADIMYFAP
jgi:hypothetical protein